MAVTLAVDSVASSRSWSGEVTVGGGRRLGEEACSRMLRAGLGPVKLLPRRCPGASGDSGDGPDTAGASSLSPSPGSNGGIGMP